MYSTTTIHLNKQKFRKFKVFDCDVLIAIVQRTLGIDDKLV